MPEFAQRVVEAYGWSRVRLKAGRPSGEAIDRMDEAFTWIARIPVQRGSYDDGELYSPHGGVLLRRIVWARLLVRPLSWQIDPERPQYIFSWARISRVIGADRRIVPVWHGAAIGTIATGGMTLKTQDKRQPAIAAP
jgi:hypothetical protein